ncbi:hypothetical protein PPYR_10303 [Photinus pyralis]|uniref:Crossover junction endonuclease MUS81 n=1 Tax=Photinus pyralis TaxID=7054 RepID=A0A1Y1NIR8_PHOPY|nr:crossover junction endonuclease MUS81 [Photinus pyralis]KAB0796242.1 hypothetical protein PPYR_10303 [Photinus pyralis]
MSGRVTVKLKTPNPLFEQWLIEWRDKAIETNSKMQNCYGKALESLRKYPLPLQSGRDCKLLKGFGEKLCSMLDKKLVEHNKNLNSNVEGGAATNRKNSIGGREYVPQWRSGPYAILIAMFEKSLEPSYCGYMFKIDIIKGGQHLSDKSFVKPDPGSFYTAWSSMKTLLDKHLVIKRSNPAKYSLTEEGAALAHKLYSTKDNQVGEPPKNNVNSEKSSTKVKTAKKTNAKCAEKTNVVQSDANVELDKEIEAPSCSSTSTQEDSFIFAPFTFDIILLVDKQETTGNSSGPLDNATLTELAHLDVLFESRHLKVGDYTWIARHKETNQELVLPYVVERKRMDDLSHSIKDGRFHEQKFRLKQCGIQNVIYLIESHGSNTHVGLPIGSLYQAATNTYIQDGFNVKFTDDVRGTVNYFATFTSVLGNIYKNKTLISCPKQNLSEVNVDDDLISLMTFTEFNQGASKTHDFKVQELFIRQLLQLKGMSVDKALAIVEQYPTPRHLNMAYQEKGGSVGQNLLATLQHGKVNKKVGAIISKVIYQLFTSASY